MILGIDEVGRGAWAGPLVVGAVVLGGTEIAGLTDSKKLGKKARERISAEIRRTAAGVGIGWVSAAMIDRIGLSAALKLATRRAVSMVRCEYDEIIIDGTIRLIEDSRVTLLKKADLLIPAVSAASVVAKVARDAYMARLDAVFEGYGFAGHVGYGTAAHSRALHELGVLPVHRTSFAPVAALGLDTPKRLRPIADPVGRRAESVAATYLEAEGHTILERNWKTPRCEIDLVSTRDGILYFNEVKYRRQPNQGGGIAAITPDKLSRMRFASDVYVSRHRMRDVERRVSVLALSGEPPVVDVYLESV